MKVTNKELSIEEILELKPRIDPKPQYQRIPVWKTDRKKLLIDSIFKGYDLPKFYLNDISGNAFYEYEVCDGQQRLRTIWEFCEDKFTTGKDASFRGQVIEGRKFTDLDEDARKYFKSFSLTISLIVEANPNEIRDLFARLQKGMGLNQAELRRALSTHIGSYVESIVHNHSFFRTCGFPDLRNKHQDYIDHAIAYMVNGFSYDFKGQSLKDLYVNISALQATQLIKEVVGVLDDMEKINSYSAAIFRNKWAFVDTFILIYQNKKAEKKVMHKDFSVAFNAFEKRRKQNSKAPSKLIETVSQRDEDKRLYEYITSFAKDGSLKSNIKRRNDAFTSQFRHLFR